MGWGGERGVAKAWVTVRRSMQYAAYAVMSLGWDGHGDVDV